MRQAAWDELVHDLRYAWRTLSRAPGFSVTAVATLAIAIGANTAIFSAVDGVLLKPLAFSAQDRIVALYQNDRKTGNARDDVAPGNFASWRERTTAFSAMAAAEPFGLVYTTPEGNEQVGNWNVTQDFFTVLDARPALGRVFVRDDFQAGRERPIVLTYESWQRRFGSDPSIVGRTLMVQGGPATVIGVLPKDFSYLATSKRYEMFTPKVLDTMEVNLRSSAWYHVVARLRPGITLAQGAADLARVARQLQQEFPRTNTDVATTVVPLRDSIVGNAARALLLLLGAVGFVLLIACSNVANLMLTRTARRQREFSVRIAIGATAGRVARQVLSESFVIALLGGVAGTALAYWGVATIRALSPASLPRVEAMQVDVRALLFALGVVVSTTFVFGLGPALRAARPSGQALGELNAGTRSAGARGHRRVRGVLVAAQVSLAVVLSIGAGLLVRSFIAVTSVDRGYSSDHVLAGTLFTWRSATTWSARAAFGARLEDRLARIPGVAAAGITTSLPLGGAIGADNGKFTIVGESVVPGEEPSAHITSLTPGAFGVLRMRLLAGRLFTASDDSSGAPVAMISESMARRHFGASNPIGRSIRVSFYGPPTTRQIVGVVADVRQDALDVAPEPTVYLPYAQAATGGITVVLRTVTEPRGMERRLKAAVAEIDARLPVSSVTTLDAIVDDSLRPRRFSATLFGAFALAALVLAVIGVYGVINHATQERTRELGVRMVLGAQPGDVVAMVLRQGLAPVLAGILIGFTGGATLTRLLESMLFEVKPFDVATFLAVGLTIVAASTVACFLPARRATRVAPAAVVTGG